MSQRGFEVAVALDGYETIVRLKQEAETREIPIIAMSAHIEERERIRALGVENFLAKPFTVGELIARLDRVLGNTQQRAQEYYGVSGSSGTETE